LFYTRKFWGDRSLTNRLKAEKKRDDKGFKKDKCFPHDKQGFNGLISKYSEGQFLV
jgi:hypothetical protein